MLGRLAWVLRHRTTPQRSNCAPNANSANCWPNQNEIPAATPTCRSLRQVGTSRPRLQDLGISRSQSSRWQAIAAVPETVFDRHLADVREQGRRDGKTE